MKKIFSLAVAAFAAIAINAQTDVTKQYIQNPDFAARFAGWVNPGTFNYSVGTNFNRKSGEVFMEKWVSSGNKLGTNSGMYQILRNLPEGTYTLVASAQNLNQSTKKAATGAFLYADKEQVEIGDTARYSVVFTVPEKTTVTIGVRLTSCTGNWVAIDNFRLYKKEANADSLAAEVARINQETETLKTNIQNATGAIPTVTTNPYMALGPRIILARFKVALNGATSLEQGVCWTTDPTTEPTIFDEKTTCKFTDTGNLYRIEGLQPATAYYVRPYVITKGYQVAYGETVKAPTMPAGGVSYGYDYAGDADQNARINSGMAETVWMYNNLSWINGLYLNVHYVYGCGAGGGTADCSYGGWMRVSQTTAYQQTGTMLHETNHGVGVGTTGEWYNSSYLRSNTSSGKWLGPRATKMVRFLENNDAAYMQGDGTHMWAGTTSGTLKYGYGINGAHEDSYQPSNQLLYFGNILITHAMHQDGLVSVSGLGFATPAYTLPQVDGKKYYIQIEDVKKGLGTKYIAIDGGSLVLKSSSAADAKADDSYAWNIAFDPATCLYTLQNVATKKYLTAGFIAGTTAGNFQLMPAREETVLEGAEGFKFTGQAYWVLKPNNTYKPGTFGLKADGTPGSVTFDFGNDATTQHWLFLDEEQIVVAEEAASHVDLTELKEMLEHVKALKDVEHTELTEGVTETFLSAVEEVENTMSSLRTADDVEQAKTALISAAIDFMEKTTTTVSQPYDITFMLTNPTLEKNYEGWTGTKMPTVSDDCAEYFQTAFDLKQILPQTMPLGTYITKVQAFQRPGTSADTKAAFPDGSAANKGTKAKLYLKATTTSKAIANIWSGAQTKSLGTGSTSVGGLYVPNNRASADKWFDAGLYQNQCLYSYNRGSSRLKDFAVGITEASSDVVTSDWTCFRNFRLYYYGKQVLTEKEIETGIDRIQEDVETSSDASCYDLTGRRIQKPSVGLYIQNGKKVIVK